MTAREHLMAWLATVCPELVQSAAFSEQLDMLEAEAYRKGQSAGYHQRGQVDWELR